MATWYWKGNIEIGTLGQSINTGDGSPEGVVTGPKGSLYLRADGSAGGCLFVKETNSGNTGWIIVGTGGGGGGTPGGSNTQVQYDDTGTFGGDANFTWDKITQVLTVLGSLTTGIVTLDQIVTSGGPSLNTGVGSPEGVVSSPVGSLYLRQDGSTSSSIYVKETGSGNTGWVAINGPKGVDKSIQFNNSGVLFGDSSLKWDTSAKVFTLNGAVSTFVIADTADITYPYYVNNQSLNFSNITGTHAYIGGRNLSVNYQGTTGLPAPIQLFGDLILVNNGTSSDAINNIIGQLVGVQTSGSSDVSGYIGSSIVVSHGSTGAVGSLLGVKIQITGPSQTSSVNSVSSIYVVQSTVTGWTGLSSVSGIDIEDQGATISGGTVGAGIRIESQTNGSYGILALGGVSKFTGVATNLVTKVANYTATFDDYSINCNGTFILTLPTTNIKLGQMYQIKNIGTGVITISSSVNIDFSLSQSLSVQGQSINVQWDGTQWWIY